MARGLKPTRGRNRHPHRVRELLEGQRLQQQPAYPDRLQRLFVHLVAEPGAQNDGQIRAYLQQRLRQIEPRSAPASSDP
ncbi:MAG: hypothetical protein MZV70_10410 [Desulfobacterales bacterium]|nr:hypothetical protein [Desulfobacterales bacterium]